MNPAQHEAIVSAIAGNWLLADRLEIEALIESRSQPFDRDDPFPDVDHNDDDVQLHWKPIRVWRQFGTECRTAILWQTQPVTCLCMFDGAEPWQRACKDCGGSGLMHGYYGKWCVTDTDCRRLLEEELPMGWRS